MANDSNHTYVLACAVVFLTLCPIFVGLRLYGIKLRKHALGADDWLATSALFLVMGCAIALIIGVRQEIFGYPTPKNDPGNKAYRINQQLQWAFFLMVIPALGMIKLSFVFFFRRIFHVGRRGSAFNIISLAIAVATVLWTAAFFLWFLLSCSSNFAGRWTSHKANVAACATDDMSDLALAISDVITDAFIYLLPIPMVFRLQMKTSRKITVLAVFALGSAALVASIVRLSFFVFITQVAEGKIIDPDLDVNLLVTRSLYWSMIEVGLSLICCCIPTLKAVAQIPGLQSAVNSVRSAISLQTIGSGRRSRSRLEDQLESAKGNGLAGGDSVKGFADSADNVESGTAAARKNSQSSSAAASGGPVPEKGIRVEHTIEQEWDQGWSKR